MLDISSKHFIFLKTFNSEFSDTEIWFTDQSSKLVEIEDKVNIILVINLIIVYKKWCTIKFNSKIFLKGYGFLCLLKIWAKTMVKNISKNLSSKYNLKLIDHAKQSLTNLLKTSLKTAIQKKRNQLVIWLVIILLIKSQKSQKLDHRILRR